MAETYGYPNAKSQDRLRRVARELIDHGVPPVSRIGSLSVDALQLLYQRASNPDSAADALKLLHELQTYQVELDLLYEQLQANEMETLEELTHYKSIYDLAPAAYLIVANDGHVIEANESAGILFDQPAMELEGKALSALLAPDQDAAVKALLGHSGESPSRGCSMMMPDQRRLSVSARKSRAGDSILVVLMEAPSAATGS